MMTRYASQVFSEIVERIGQGVETISFGLTLEQGSLQLDHSHFDLFSAEKANGAIIFAGQWEDISIVWEFVPFGGGYQVSLQVERETNLNCVAIDSIIIHYHSHAENITDWYVPTLGLDVVNVGMPRISELQEHNRAGTKLRGVFPNSREVGLFVGTLLPQSHLHLHSITKTGENGIKCSSTTSFMTDVGQSKRLTSEITWVCANKPIANAIQTYSTHLPHRGSSDLPAVGWNSWDYYYRAISLADMIENMDAIKLDVNLNQHIKYIVVDSGWEHVEGEWFANYRFPSGLEGLVQEIESRNFIPGVWTDPIRVTNLSTIALRSYDILIKNEYGDPQAIENSMYMVDPTHPEGKAYIRELYTRLFQTGFRFFKIDFVECLLRAHRFYDATKGPYDALRDLFALIRESVTGDSHILGCSLPAECGPGTADSGRIGIDIHNQWSHVEWAFDYLQLSYWQHNRIWTNDPDFLVVRGLDTSSEEETNVLNPKAHQPNPPRWRSGPVFTLDEARTWGNIVALSGGNVFLSDRINKLNVEGRELLDHWLEPTGFTAQPLDLCDRERASLWLMKLGQEYRLTLINWLEEKQAFTFTFGEYNLAAPDQVYQLRTKELAYRVHDGAFHVTLGSHESIVVCWAK